MTRRNKSALDALVNRRRLQTEERGKEVMAKRAKRKTEREELADKFSEQLSNGGQTVKERLNWKVIRSWFREELERNFGEKHSLPPEHEWWAGKEISLAKRLLKLYSGDLIHEGIIHLCESWESMVEESHGKLSGLPTMGFLWSTRERIIGAVEAGEQPREKGRKRHHRAEYDPDKDDMPGVGW